MCYKSIIIEFFIKYVYINCHLLSMKYSFAKLIGAKGAPNYKTEILSGLTVALALVPEAIAFAMIAGFSPLTGLYAAFVMGFITSIFGGRPGMISGATGAVAVVLVGLVYQVKAVFPEISSEEVLNYVFSTIMLAGLIQISIGVLKLGKFIRLVPHPVMYGFVNGLGIIIFMAQIPSITSIISENSALSSFFSFSGEAITNTALLKEGWMELATMIALVLLTMFIIWKLPKLTKAVPASLVAVLTVSIIVVAFGIETTTVADTLLPGETISGSFPPFSCPSIPFNLDSLMIILPFAVIIAGVGLIESLLTLNIIDEVTESRGSSNRECVAQGVANITSGLFSGMGGCAMIGQSLINTSAGARTRLSGVVASVMLLMFVMFGASIIGKLPMAALVGLMFMVAITTFEWASLRTFRKMPKSDVFVMVAVTLIIAFTHNLAIAVAVGVVFSALAYAWENAKRIRARKHIDENGVKYYEIYGPLFFASVKAFTDKFDPTNDPDEVIVDFAESRIVDMSAIAALNAITERYSKQNKRIRLRHLSEDCHKLLLNADEIIDVNVIEDPRYRIPLDHPQKRS